VHIGDKSRDFLLKSMKPLLEGVERFDILVRLVVVGPTVGGIRPGGFVLLGFCVGLLIMGGFFTFLCDEMLHGVTCVTNSTREFQGLNKGHGICVSPADG
jgi:hypothetical protein